MDNSLAEGAEGRTRIPAAQRWAISIPLDLVVAATEFPSPTAARRDDRPAAS